MSILQAKYKAHKFVNSIFYSAIFLIGFLLGFGAKYIDFSKLISNFLFIDNVEAFTIRNLNGVNIDENLIISSIKDSYPDFDLKETPYVLCEFYGAGSLTQDRVDCILFNQDVYDSLSFYDYSPSYGWGIIHYNLRSDFLYSIKFHYDHSIEVNKSTYYYDGLDFDFAYSHTWNKGYSNFDLTFLNSKLSGRNTLDFSNFLPLSFRDDIFENDDFNKYCVDINKSFAITADSSALLSNGRTYFKNDFLWFPYHLTGLYWSEYTTQVTSSNPDHIRIYNDDIATEHFWFKDNASIDEIYSDEINSNYFIHGGYTNKYDYYGYSAYKFSYSYFLDVDGDYGEAGSVQTIFPIYSFKNPKVTYIDNVDLLPNYTFDDEFRNNKVCFYLRKPLIVQGMNKDSFGDYYGEVITPEGTFKAETSYNKSHYDNSSSFNSVTGFITGISDNLVFVKDSVTDLYNSMPFLLQLFILAVFNILLFKIIIGMVVR